jgi:hypothetical protein
MAYSTIVTAAELLTAMSNFRLSVSLERLLKRLGRKSNDNAKQG